MPIHPKLRHFLSPRGLATGVIANSILRLFPFTAALLLAIGMVRPKGTPDASAHTVSLISRVLLGIGLGLVMFLLVPLFLRAFFPKPPPAGPLRRGDTRQLDWQDRWAIPTLCIALCGWILGITSFIVVIFNTERTATISGFAFFALLLWLIAEILATFVMRLKSQAEEKVAKASAYLSRLVLNLFKCGAIALLAAAAVCAWRDYEGLFSAREGLLYAASILGMGACIGLVLIGLATRATTA